MRAAVRRLAAALAGAALAVLAPGWLAPTPASAHAYLARSAPADGAVLDRAPEVLTLSFTERVELPAARISIVDGDGRAWAVTSLVLRTTDGSAAGTDARGDVAEAAGVESPVTLVAGLPRLPANTYHVTWHTLSSDDLHATSGTLVFGVQRAVAAAAAAPAPVGPGPRESVLRAVTLLGTAVLVGGAALALLDTTLRSRPAPGRPFPPMIMRLRSAFSAPRARKLMNNPGLSGPLLRVAGAAGAVALVATPGQLMVQVAADGGRWRGLLLHQLTTGRWLLREAGLALLLAAVVWAARARRPVGAPVVVGAIGALSAACGTALLGHPMSGGPATVLVGGVHLLAAGGWAGSVLTAALVAPALLRGPGGGERLRSLLRAFAALAVTCVAALALTGFLLAGAQVATVDALLTTPYGLLLLAKLAAAATAGLLGLRTARRLRRTGGALHRSALAAEAVLLAGALALAGTLAAAGPPRGPRFPIIAAAAAQPQASGQVADLVDTLRVRPNRPGTNVVTVTVNDTRRPAPGPVTGVSVALAGPDGTQRVHPVTRGPEGWTVAVDDIRAPGNWRISVTIMRDGLAPVTDAHRWAVPATPVPVRFSAAPVKPVTDGLALLAAAAGLVTAGYAARRRWMRRREAATGATPAALDHPTLDPAVLECTAR